MLCAAGRCGGSPPFKSCGQRKKKKETGPHAIFARPPSADPMAAGTMSGDHLGAAAVWSVGARRLLRSHTKRFVVMGSAQIILRIFGRRERQSDGAGQSPSSQVRATLVADRSAVRLEKRMDDGDAESEAACGRGVAYVAQARDLLVGERGAVVRNREFGVGAVGIDGEITLISASGSSFTAAAAFLTMLRTASSISRRSASTMRPGEMSSVQGMRCEACRRQRATAVSTSSERLTAAMERWRTWP